MSKSLGNMVFVDKLLKKYSAQIIRLYLLSHEWWCSWNYEENELKNIAKVTKALIEPEQKVFSKDELLRNLPEFKRALDENLNIPRAIDSLIQTLKKEPQKSPQVAFAARIILGL